jgi:predicted secreted acid phosphatase
MGSGPPAPLELGASQKPPASAQQQAHTCAALATGMRRTVMMTALHRWRNALGPELLIGVLLLALPGCDSGPAPADANADFVTVSSQPPNVGDAKIAALAYHDSGAYNRDLTTVANQAGSWLASRAPAVTQPALVLDIDETALSNWDIIKRDDFGRPIGGLCEIALDAPCGWAAWDQLGRDPAIMPTLGVFQQARALNVTVFFITGRPESQREATERNLVAAGYVGYAKLYMVPNGAHFASAVDFKAPVRVQIEEAGYTIIANIGDQPSDLLGGHAERKFLLPDPFYRVP